MHHVFEKHLCWVGNGRRLSPHSHGFEDLYRPVQCTMAIFSRSIGGRVEELRVQLSGHSGTYPAMSGSEYLGVLQPVQASTAPVLDCRRSRFREDVGIE